jgi:small subunit ribosomal protein S7
MPRKGEVRRREVLPDPKFHDRTVTKFINSMMSDGEKSIAERILYGSLELIRDRTKQDPLEIFKRALDNAKPAVEVRSRRVGGATYQVPVEVRPPRRISLAMRWLVPHARERSEKSMAERLRRRAHRCRASRGATIKRRKTHTEWRTPTRRTPIIGGNRKREGGDRPRPASQLLGNHGSKSAARAHS